MTYNILSMVVVKAKYFKFGMRVMGKETEVIKHVYQEILTGHREYKYVLPRDSRHRMISHL